MLWQKVRGRHLSSLHKVDISRQKKALPLQQSLRVVQLSDLHVGWYVGADLLADWVARANAQQPDLIVITGDFLDGWFQTAKETLEPLANLNAPLGVWAVMGNHDRTRFRDSEAFRDYLAGLNVRLLVNTWQQARDDLIIAGAQDYTDYVQQGEAEMQDWLEQLSETFQSHDHNANRKHAKILMLHNPDFLPIVAQSQCPFDVILCGHTHGGQIHLPKLGPVYTSSRFGTRFVSGWQSEFRAYISRGLGVTSLPIRWNCPAEMVVWQLEPDIPIS